MATNHFVVETDPTFEDVRFLEDRLYAYNEVCHLMVTPGQYAGPQ
jgi:hypothetical protein